MIKAFIRNTLIVQLIFCIVVPVQAYELLDDNLPEDYIERHGAKKTEYNPHFYEDEAAKVLKGRISTKKHFYKPIRYVDVPFSDTENDSHKKLTYKPIKIKETYVPATDMLTHFKKPHYTGKVVLNPGIPVKVTPITSYTSTINVYVTDDDYDAARKRYKEVIPGPSPRLGAKIEFKTVDDVYAGSKLIIPKGQKVIANITSSVPSSAGGEGGEIAASRFRTKDINGQLIYLDGEVTEIGASTGLILYIFATAIAPFTFGMSYLLLLGPGVSGTLQEDKVYTVYYNAEN